MKTPKPKKSTARKTSKVPTKIMTFGAFIRDEGQRKIVSDMVFQAHLYRRRLLDIEITRRNAFRALRCRLSPKMEQLEAKASSLEEQIQELRSGLKAKALRNSPEQLERLEKISALKAEKLALYPQIKKEREAVDAKHFARGDQLKKELLEEEGTLVLQRLDKKSFGSNDNAYKELKARVFETMQQRRARYLEAWQEKDRIDHEARQACLRAREETPCPHGVYMAVEDAIKRAKQDAKRDPRHKVFDKRGKVGVQLSKDKGLTVAKALSCQDPWLKIDDKVGEREKLKVRGFLRAQRRGEYRRAARVTLKLEGTEDKAVRLDLNVVLHRELPSDGVIKWAYLYVRRVGYRTLYELQLTLESKTFKPKEAADSGHVALNLGWRLMPNGDIKVATIWDGACSSEVVLPGSLDKKKGMNANRVFVEKLLGYADEKFDVALRTYTKWLEGVPVETKRRLTPLLRAAMPGHLREELDTLPKIRKAMLRWRSHEKLIRVSRTMTQEFVPQDRVVKLWTAWRQERKNAQYQESQLSQQQRGLGKVGTFTDYDLFAPFEELNSWFKARGVRDECARMALYLDWWCRKDSHLICWARDVQQKTTLWRREIYRRKAVELSRQYRDVIVERWDKSVTAQNPEPEADTRSPHEMNASALRQFAGVSIFVEALKGVFGKRFHERSAKNITVKHHGCRGKTSKSLSVTTQLLCPKCGKTYNQDLNAAKHLWDKFTPSKRSGGAKPTRGSRTRESLPIAAE